MKVNYSKIYTILILIAVVYLMLTDQQLHANTMLLSVAIHLLAEIKVKLDKNE